MQLVFIGVGLAGLVFFMLTVPALLGFWAGWFIMDKKKKP